MFKETNMSACFNAPRYSIVVDDSSLMCDGILTNPTLAVRLGFCSRYVNNDLADENGESESSTMEMKSKEV